MFFRAMPWRIRFADYNHDGQIDFNLGQYDSCNGWLYKLFTISPTGQVTPLLKPGDGIPSTDNSNSTSEIRVTKAGFCSNVLRSRSRRRNELLYMGYREARIRIGKAV